MSHNVVSEQRAREILAAYGSNAEQWPPEERQGVELLLQKQPELLAIRQTEASLDAILSSHTVTTSSSLDALLSAIDELPEQTRVPSVERRTDDWIERVLSWLMPASPMNWWRPAIAAMLPLALGIAIGASNVTVNEDWEASEQYVFSLGYEEVSNG